MEIVRIMIFPFKSLKGIDINETLVDKHGFLHDRVYMLAHCNKQGEWKSVTQRTEPSLQTVETTIHGNTLILTHSKNGKERSVTLPLNAAELPQNTDIIDMELWSYQMQCADLGKHMPQIVDFFHEVIGNQKKYEKLTFVTSKHRRKVPALDDETKEFLNNQDREFESSFQDIWPGSLMTTASYENLETKCKIKKENVDISMDSFRMNLLVNSEEAWVEDDWLEVKINGHVWHVQGPAERCPMPAVDTEKGEIREARMPLPVLNNFRVLKPGRTPCFGINLINEDYNYVLKVGDRLEVTKLRQ